MWHGFVAVRMSGEFFLLVVLLLVLLSFGNAAALSQCVWVFNVNEGETSTNVLQGEWGHGLCADNYVGLEAAGSLLPGFRIPNTNNLVVQYKPPTTGLMEGDVRHTSQEVSVTCGVSGPVCKRALVCYVVNGVSRPNPDIKLKQVDTTGRYHVFSEQPLCPVSSVIPTVNVKPKVATVLYPLRYVKKCGDPQRLEISSFYSNAGGPQKKYFSVEKDVVLWFNQNAKSEEDGFFSVNLTIYCGGVPSCFNVQAGVNVVKPALMSFSEKILCSCSSPYDFRLDFLQKAEFVIKPHAADACGAGTSAIFTLVLPPEDDVGNFFLERHTGAFNYSAPAGPMETNDTFFFTIGCNANRGTKARTACIGTARIFVTEPPQSPQANVKETPCPGDFVFTYKTDGGGHGMSNFYNLLAQANSKDKVTFCTGNDIYTAAQLRTKPKYGMVTSFNNKTGDFYYLHSGESLVDSFTFFLACGSKRVCYATAIMQPLNKQTTGPGAPQSVYHLESGSGSGSSIVCTGTCDAAAWRSSPHYPGVFDVTDGPNGDRGHVTPRRDGMLPDSMEFQIINDGDSLLIRSHTTIGNMAARFVTFLPLENLESPFLTSESVPKGANPSFNATCLDKQAKVGFATSIWTWANSSNVGDDSGKAAMHGHINRETKNYITGENYFQKFGGKHRDCDVFRHDPCKYAPMLTPSVAKNRNTLIDRGGCADAAIDWMLYVNGCDATWVGNISLTRLRSLCGATTNKPLFKLINRKTLVGKIYTQVVKPASWKPPYKGTLSMQRAYTLSILMRDSIATSVEVVTEAESKTVFQSKNDKEETVSGGNTGNFSFNPSAAPSTGYLQGTYNISAFVRFATAIDSLTAEWLYGYALLIYPHQLNHSGGAYSSSTATRVKAKDLLPVTEVRVFNASWTIPDFYDYPESTGQARVCTKDVDGLEFDCDSLVYVEPAKDLLLFPKFQLTSEEKSEEGNRFIYIPLVARVVGGGASRFPMGSPEGSFSVQLRLATSESLVINVKHSGYIEAIKFGLQSTLCRSSPYWPVLNAFDSSLPCMQFNVSRMLQDIFRGLVKNDKGRDRKYYGSPMPVKNHAVCSARLNPQPSISVLLNNDGELGGNNKQDISISGGISLLQPTLCGVNNMQIYGATDWVYFSLHKRPKDSIDLSSMPFMSLDYLVFSVDAAEVFGLFKYKNVVGNTSKIHFVLDGTSLPADTGDDVVGSQKEEQRWMGDGGVAEKSQVYLPWEQYAAFLHYRRIHVRNCDVGSGAEKCVMEPFHFAFVPGALLHSSSSASVSFHIRAAVRFAPAVGVGPSRVEEHSFKIFVSPYTLSTLRIEHHRNILSAVTPRKHGLSRKLTIMLFMIFAFATVGVLAVGFIMETRYTNRIASAMRHLQRQQLNNCERDLPNEEGLMLHAISLGNHDGCSAVGIGTFCDKGSNSADRENKGDITGIMTNYGIVELEPTRVVEMAVTNEGEGERSSKM